MIRANGRSALMIALGVLATIAVAAPAAADDLNTPVFVAPTANGTQPNSGAQPEGQNQSTQPEGQNQAADPNQLNEMDRASPAGAAAQPSAPAAGSDTAASSAPASSAASNTAPAASAASSQHSIWNETSLIGKIFIGFGALLTIASAARMFMA